jgi:hypothetical protein
MHSFNGSVDLLPSTAVVADNKKGEDTVDYHLSKRLVAHKSKGRTGIH